VRKFEDSRQDSSTYGLICPRWVLHHAKGDVANEESKLDGNSNRETIYNAYPKRNYIDLRMEQNRMFANDQYDQCKALLAKLSQPSTTSQSTPSTNNDINNNNKQWKKQADTIQSLLNEGLASCPNHIGLLQAEKEYKEWIQKRIHILSTPSLPTKQTTVDKTTPSNSTLLPNSAYSSSMRKGAENRAQAALRDAQLERSFMLDGNAKDDEKDNNNNNMYPLLSANDEDQQGDVKGSYKEEESLSSGSDTDEDSRRRKKSKRNYKKHKRSKSRHDHGDRRRRKRDRRSRSRSMSRSHSRSISSSSQSSDSYRRRKHRRKEKKRRKKKKRRRHRESISFYTI